MRDWQIIDWCIINGLSINWSKYILITHERPPIINNDTINGHLIERVDKTRDLGVILDKKLNAGNSCNIRNTCVAIWFYSTSLSMQNTHLAIQKSVSCNRCSFESTSKVHKNNFNFRRELFHIFFFQLDLSSFPDQNV